MRASRHHAQQTAASSEHLSSSPWRWAFEQAQSSWGWGPLDFDAFCAHLIRLGYSKSLPTETASLYLCAGCTNGIGGAWQTLEALYFPNLRQVLRAECPAGVLDDIVQEVRDRLLVGPLPKIATYRGSGPLAGWLHRVACNLARDRMRAERTQRQRLLQLSAQLDSVTPEPQRSPEDAIMEAQLAAACQGALAEVLRAISARDRQLLQHYFVSNLNIDQIGALYEVDRSTAARWINGIVKTARERLARALRPLLGSFDGQLSQLFPMVSSQASPALTRCLQLSEEWPTQSPLAPAH